MKRLTDFQKRVYKEVKKIPRGKTKTYKQIALKLKTSARAIAKALSKNYNPKIPCHRVIMSNGNLGGYNRGVKRKKELLRKEKSI